MQVNGILSAGPTNKNVLNNLTSSLRWRQMASSLVIIATGVAVSGLVYFYIKSHSSLNNQGVKMHSDASLILDSIERHDSLDLFILGEHVDEDIFLNNLKERGFTTPFNNISEKEYYAYIQSIENPSISWSSKHPNERSINNVSPYSTLAKRDFSTFSFPERPLSDQHQIVIQSPVKSNGRNPRNSKLVQKNPEYIVYSQDFAYANGPRYRIVLAKSAEGYKRDKNELARGIGGLVLITTLFVLIAQFVGSYFVLAPIRRIEKEIKDIESGDSKRIEHDYPSELLPIKSAVNTLINAEKGQKQRYREALDNLAHALKTPLASLQGASERASENGQVNQATLDEEIQRMSALINYHLRRAVVSNHNNTMVQQQKLRPIIYRLRTSLTKVHFDKEFDMSIDIDEYAQCRVEYEDLMEVFGNLLNNACRFCESRINVTATQDVNFLIVDIDDDGMGFPENNPSQLLKRGMRADSKTEGQGIGLAVSAEIIQNAGGKITLLMSPFVGARVRLHLPV
ncbi:GHKL domain-containing protein [Leucothrix sargassi]|nr:GHKL domain-containing protein [Leucothrix sargassi]